MQQWHLLYQNRQQLTPYRRDLLDLLPDKQGTSTSYNHLTTKQRPRGRPSCLHLSHSGLYFLLENSTHLGIKLYANSSTLNSSDLFFTSIDPHNANIFWLGPPSSSVHDKSFVQNSPPLGCFGGLQIPTKQETSFWESTGRFSFPHLGSGALTNPLLHHDLHLKNPDSDGVHADCKRQEAKQKVQYAKNTRKTLKDIDKQRKAWRLLAWCLLLEPFYLQNTAYSILNSALGLTITYYNYKLSSFAKKKKRLGNLQAQTFVISACRIVFNSLGMVRFLVFKRPLISSTQSTPEASARSCSKTDAHTLTHIHIYIHMFQLICMRKEDSCKALCQKRTLLETAYQVEITYTSWIFFAKALSCIAWCRVACWTRSSTMRFMVCSCSWSVAKQLLSGHSAPRHPFHLCSKPRRPQLFFAAQGIEMSSAKKLNGRNEETVAFWHSSSGFFPLLRFLAEGPRQPQKGLLSAKCWSGLLRCGCTIRWTADRPAEKHPVLLECWCFLVYVIDVLPRKIHLRLSTIG